MMTNEKFIEELNENTNLLLDILNRNNFSPNVRNAITMFFVSISLLFDILPESKGRSIIQEMTELIIRRKNRKNVANLN